MAINSSKYYEGREEVGSTKAAIKISAPVDDQSSRVGGATDRLVKLSGMLAERLEPVLGPDRPVMANDAEKDIALSPHASFLRAHALQLEGMAAHLEALLARLEI